MEKTTMRYATWLTGWLAGFTLLAGSGCSLLVDTSDYVGEGNRDDAGVDGGQTGSDGGVTDGGGTDAGPPPPTTPELHIEPSAPTTLDDLTLVLDTESTDPLDAGEVSYEFTWRRDEGVIDELVGTTVPANRTRKTELWEVQATPVAGDGRRGAPGRARSASR